MQILVALWRSDDPILFFYMCLLILIRFFYLFSLGGVKSDLHIFAGSDKYAELCKLHSIYVCFFDCAILKTLNVLGAAKCLDL